MTELETVNREILDSVEREKTTLEVFKDSDCVLQPKVYAQLHDTITATYNSQRRLLTKRQDAIIDRATAAVKAERICAKIKLKKRDAIANRFELRRLEYENRLYKKQCAAQYKLDKRNLFRQYMARILPLRAAARQPFKPMQPLYTPLKRPRAWRKRRHASLYIMNLPP